MLPYKTLKTKSSRFVIFVYLNSHLFSHNRGVRYFLKVRMYKPKKRGPHPCYFTIYGARHTPHRVTSFKITLRLLAPQRSKLANPHPSTGQPRLQSTSCNSEISTLERATVTVTAGRCLFYVVSSPDFANSASLRSR